MKVYKLILLKTKTAEYKIKIDHQEIIIECPSRIKWAKDRNLESVLLYYKNKKTLISYKTIKEETE